MRNTEFLLVQYNEPRSMELFNKFYTEIYCTDFIDPDEQEDLESFHQYLLNNNSGNQNNNYRVVLLLESNLVIGCAIFDYLPLSNCGIIEYIVIKDSYRRRGFGKLLLEKIECFLDSCATERGQSNVEWIFAEVNNPWVTDRSKESSDPTARLLYWRQMGFSHLDFPYCQPALIEGKQPVLNLLFIGNGVQPKPAIPSQILNTAVIEYLMADGWLSNPEKDVSVKEMLNWLLRNEYVYTKDLANFM